MVRRLTNELVPYPNFAILIVNKAPHQKELFVTVDHAFVPDASDDRDAVCLGLGGLDEREFCGEVDALIEQLQHLKVLAAKHFGREKQGSC